MSKPTVKITAEQAENVALQMHAVHQHLRQTDPASGRVFWAAASACGNDVAALKALIARTADFEVQ
jgi:hypothetical protein